MPPARTPATVRNCAGQILQQRRVRRAAARQHDRSGQVDQRGTPLVAKATPLRRVPSRGTDAAGVTTLSLHYGKPHPADPK